MSWFGSIFGGGVGTTLEAAGGLAKDIEDVFSTSDRERLDQYRAETERAKVDQANELGQLAINREEARHRSIFVAGWRPMIGWVCGIAMVFHFLIYPLFGKALEQYTGYPIVDLNWEELSIILMGMLGFGGIRAYEKVKGIAREEMGPRRKP